MVKIKAIQTIILDAEQIPSYVESTIKKAFGKVGRVSKGEGKYFAWVTTTDVKKEVLSILIKERKFMSIAPEGRDKIVVLFKA